MRHNTPLQADSQQPRSHSAALEADARSRKKGLATFDLMCIISAPFVALCRETLPHQTLERTIIGNCLATIVVAKMEGEFQLRPEEEPLPEMAAAATAS